MTASSSRWISAWIGAASLGVANGIGREALYAEAVGEEAAHIVSTATLLGLLGGYMRLCAAGARMARIRDLQALLRACG